MNELTVSLKVAHAFELMGYDANKVTDAIICPRCHRKIVPSRGRPDRAMIHPSARSCYIEVKTVRRNETAFSFSEISDEQRATLNDWLGRGGACYLALGVIRRPKRNDRLEWLYLVEWSKWVALENLVRPHQDSIPVKAGPGFSKELQKRNLDIETQLWPWSLGQRPGGWFLPQDHPAIEQLGVKSQ